ncbi:MAG: RNA-binding protein [Candidatus Verstraetearchaeota archaeon]|nr:RNA methyltransferase [Candidatus Methanomethylicia archaeon]NHV45068.1 RNA-binding protein [Candidatus Verstraetearchaeota archaeon]
MSLKRNYNLTVCIPSSIVSLVDTLIEKTILIGQIARTISIYRVNRILIYIDSEKKDLFFIKELLEYLETPQYLRKYLFPISKNLRYAGCLPPLRTPHHPTIDSEIGYRDGFVIESNDKKSIVDIGFKEPIICPYPLPRNKRVSLKKEKEIWIPVKKEEIPYYWGYEVIIDLKGLHHHLVKYNYDYVIATSRLGKPINIVFKEIKEMLKPGKNIAILFGSPREGLHNIFLKYSLNLEDYCDVIVNMVPNQGTQTIRTEEALMISLAILSFIDEI